MADGREEAGEEEEEEGFGSVQERAMFLLDLGKGDLFESADGGAETRLEFAMKIVLAFIKGRLVGGAASKDVVGLAACGDGRGGAAGRTIFGLGPPSAKVARPLQDGLEAGVFRSAEACGAWLGAFEDRAVATEDGALRNGLHACQRCFDGHAAKGPSSTSVIYVFSGTAEPCGRAAEAEVCVLFARDSADVDREIQLAHFGLGARDLPKFWGPLLEANTPEAKRRSADPPDWRARAYAAAGAHSVEAHAQTRAAGRRHRSAEKLALRFPGGGGGGEKGGGDAAVVVRVVRRPLARPAPPLATRAIDVDTNAVATTRSTAYDEITGATLDETDVRTYVPLGPLGVDGPADARRAHRAYVDRADVKACDDASVLGFDDAEVAVLGFADRGDVFAGPADVFASKVVSVLAPDDDLAPGSTEALAALVDALRDADKLAVARYAKRAFSAAPRLCALAPHARGLLVVELPFADERRRLPPPSAGHTTKRPRDDDGDDDGDDDLDDGGTSALDGAASRLVAALSARAQDGAAADPLPPGIPNPQRRTHFAVLEAAAFGLDDAGPDSVVERAWRAGDDQRPDASKDPRLRDAADAVADALPASSGHHKATAAGHRPPKRPKPPPASALPAHLLVDPLDRDAIKRDYTAKAIQQTAADLGLAKSGTKDAVLDRIAQHLADGGAAPPAAAAAAAAP